MKLEQHGHNDEIEHPQVSIVFSKSKTNIYIGSSVCGYLIQYLFSYYQKLESNIHILNYQPLLMKNIFLVKALYFGAIIFANFSYYLQSCRISKLFLNFATHKWFIFFISITNIIVFNEL